MIDRLQAQGKDSPQNVHHGHMVLPTIILRNLAQDYIELSTDIIKQYTVIVNHILQQGWSLSMRSHRSA